MAICWNCDICGKSTFVNPPSKQSFREDEVEVSIPVKVLKDNAVVESVQKQKVKKLVPETVKIRRQNASGDIEQVEIPKLIFEKEKTVILQLRVGDENIQKDFCQACYKKHLSEDVNNLWLKLEQIKSR